MELKILNEPFPHFIIENVFSESELKSINRELLFLASKMSNDTGSAKNKFSHPAKKGQGVFLEKIFRDTKNSDIGVLLHSIVTPEIMTKLQDKNNDILIRYFYLINCREVLIQMYKNGDYYDTHTDKSLYTSVLLIHKTPKQYTGGNLIFPDHNDYTPKLENNCVIYFPSIIPHKVSEIKMESNEDSDARFAITQFLGSGLFPREHGQSKQ
jgi:hypothetical protein